MKILLQGNRKEAASQDDSGTEKEAYQGQEYKGASVVDKTGGSGIEELAPGTGRLLLREGTQGEIKGAGGKGERYMVEGEPDKRGTYIHLHLC